MPNQKLIALSRFLFDLKETASLKPAKVKSFKLIPDVRKGNTFDVASYFRAGGGRGETSNEDYQWSGIVERPGGYGLVFMVLDGLTGLIDDRLAIRISEAYDGQTGGRVASHEMGKQIKSNLQLGLTPYDAVIKSNIQLGEMNQSLGLTGGGELMSTMLSLVVVEPNQQVYTLTIGDSQVWFPSLNYHIKGDQDDMEDVFRKVIFHVPDRDRQFLLFKDQRDVINEQDRSEVFSRQQEIVRNLGITLDKNKDYRFSAMNGQPHVSNVIRRKLFYPGVGAVPFALFSDGISDGVANDYSWLEEELNRDSVSDTALSIESRVRSTVESGGNSGFKRWGDDETLIVVKENLK